MFRKRKQICESAMYAAVQKACLEQKIAKDCMFKKCSQFDLSTRRRKKFIVVLEQNAAVFTCNEGRNGIKNKNLALFRATGVIPRLIIDYSKLEQHESILHRPNMCYREYDQVYEIGVTITISDYDFDQNNIRGPGIHYVKTLLAAMLYDDENELIPKHNANGARIERQSTWLIDFFATLTFGLGGEFPPVQAVNNKKNYLQRQKQYMRRRYMQPHPHTKCQRYVPCVKN